MSGAPLQAPFPYFGRMTTREPTPRAEDWRRTNPEYQSSPPRVSKSGRVVEIEASTLWEYERMLKQMNQKGRK